MKFYEDYLDSKYIFTPFFIVVGDDEYVFYKEFFEGRNIKVVGLSNYCSSFDRVPNMDNLFEDLKNGEIDVLVGLGEYLALNGEQVAFDMLLKLQNYKLNDKKTVIILRAVTDIIKKLQANDLRFDKRCVVYGRSVITNISLTCIPDTFKWQSSCNGLKKILEQFESGCKLNIVAKTKMNFTNGLFEIHNITTAYEGVKYLLPTFKLSQEYGNNEQWDELLTDLFDADYNIDAVFAKHGFSKNLIDDFYRLSQGVLYENWLYFIALKLAGKDLSNLYLHHVVDVTSKFNDLKNNVINTIIEISHNDKRFECFYEERKKLVAKFNEVDIAAFVRDNKMNYNEGLYKLTDQTRTEREELVTMFAILDKQIVLKRIENVYTILYDYLKPYTFQDQKLNAELCALLTDYFNQYKWQKVQNSLDESFVSHVEQLAKERKYNLIQSRSDIINKIDKKNCKLYWIDALGVEFLSFIQSTCNHLNIKIKIHIGRAELPTITTINKNFYDEWKEGEKVKFSELDKIKHEEAGGYNYENNKLPIHLVRELDVITDILEKIALDLTKHNCAKALIVSDHGASRLAVIKEEEMKYEVDTKGEYSGRCCKTFTDYDIPFAAEENGYLTLANYGRFRGSRKSNVEVHGGASLEEVIVPIIELSLIDFNIKIKIVNDLVYVDYRNCAEFVISSNVMLDQAKVIINEKIYMATQIYQNHYKIITDITRAKTYNVDVFDGDNFICKLSFTAQGKNKSNTDFKF